VTPCASYLEEGHEPTTVGLLLGLACQERGTADATAHTVICMHIPALSGVESRESTPAMQVMHLKHSPQC